MIFQQKKSPITILANTKGTKRKKNKMKIIQKNKIYLFFPLDKFNVRHKVENNNMNNGQKKNI